GNWHREIDKFGPSLRVVSHYGTDRSRTADALREASKGGAIVLTTYALARRDAEILREVGWHRVICDEAQNIKNPSAQQTKALRSFRAETRVALTGTPVENRLIDLWSIMEFALPGYIGPLEQFKQRFALPIERYHDAEAAE